MKYDLYMIISGNNIYYYIDISDVRYRITYDNINKNVMVFEKIGLSSIPTLGKKVTSNLPAAVELIAHRLVAKDIESSLRVDYLPPNVENIEVGKLNEIESTQIGEYDARRKHNAKFWGFVGFLMGLFGFLVGILLTRLFVSKSNPQPNAKILASLNDNKGMPIEWYKEGYVQEAKRNNRETATTASIIGAMLSLLAWFVIYLVANN